MSAKRNRKKEPRKVETSETDDPGSAGRKALVVGATGLVGNHLIFLLLNHPQYAKVTVLTRNKVPHSHPKLEQHLIDFERIGSVSQDLFAADDAFCCLGTTLRAAGSREAFREVDQHYVLRFAQAVIAAGCRNFVCISAVGASSSSRIFYSRVKGEMEDGLRAMGFRKLVILRPSLLMGPRRGLRRTERIAAVLSPFLWPFLVGPMRKYRPIASEQVARAMISEALHEAPGTHVLEGKSLDPSLFMF